MYRLLQNNVQINYKDSQCIELGIMSSPNWLCEWYESIISG